MSPKSRFKLRLLYNQQAKTQRHFIYCNKCQKKAKSSHRRSWRNNFRRPTNPLIAAALTYLFLSFLCVSTDLWAPGSWLLAINVWRMVVPVSLSVLLFVSSRPCLQLCCPITLSILLLFLPANVLRSVSVASYFNSTSIKSITSPLIYLGQRLPRFC